jgi:hypothetical protein
VTAREAWLYRLAALSLIVIVAVLRLFFLANDCRLDLAPDEAHYWDWSRHLDWSYYSKGPLVAWIIRGSCELLGPWSVSLTGNEMLAVRAPAVLFGSLLLVSLYILTVQTTGSDRIALVVVATGLTLPVLSAGSLIMTIDSPYTCCWGWALVLAHRAIFQGSRWAWSVAGVVNALGFLAKYNMALFIPSVGVFLLTSKEHRTLLRKPGFWVMSFVALLGVLPILIWNMNNGWVTFKHLFGQSGSRNPLQPLGPLHYLAGQFALMLGLWFVLWVAAMLAHQPWRESDANKRYLWWTSLPMFAIFLGFSIKTGGGELNWPVTAYLSGMVLTAIWTIDQLSSAEVSSHRLLRISLPMVILLGSLLTIFIHHSNWARPILLSISGQPKPERPYPLRRFDPSCRLRGWRTLAREVDRLRESLRARGVEPVLAATSWALPGELGFYCEGHPNVYNIGSAQGDRHSQYDFWRPNPILDPAEFRGKTFIIVGGLAKELKERNVFSYIEVSERIVHFEDGHPIAGWEILVGHDFQQFPYLDLKKLPN